MNLSKTIKELDKKIAAVKAELIPMSKRLSRLNEERAKAVSMQYIKKHGIRLRDVDVQADKEYFGTIYGYGYWLSLNSRKKWAVWNGMIYLRADLAKKRMPESVVRREDVTA